MSTFQVSEQVSHDDWKKSKLETIRNFHQDLINDLSISKVDFNMKMPFYNPQGRMVVGIFASEFKKEKGFFFELITRALEPADPERKVYRVAPSNSFTEEYDQNEKGSFLVPLDELRIVNEQAVAISKSSAVTSSDKVLTKSFMSEAIYKAPAIMEDAPYSEMTLRDYFAIHTGKAVSAKSWLNDLIKNK